MTLRTPRRRIAPRTKRRYQAIKGFLRRAIGSPSQPDIKINSSIAINVTDLKDKIVGLEHQLSEVNKHCRDLVYGDSSSRKDSQILGPNYDGDSAISLKDQTDTASIAVETTVLYKPSENHYRKSDDSASVEQNANIKDNVKTKDMATKLHTNKDNTIKKNKSKVDGNIMAFNGSQPNIRKHKNDTAYENFVSSYATTSYHSLMDPRASHGYKTTYPTRHHDKKYKHREYVDAEAKVRKQKSHIKRSPETVSANYELKHKHKTKNTSELDKEFIADIIKRQYRPVKMFGKTESGITQISAPICRDQEFPIRESIIEGSELCSCCVNSQKKCKYKDEHDLNVMRSICDTRLYSSKRQMRQKYQKRHDIYKQYHDVYNNSELYDLIPVKEKASPKLRRKIAAEETVPYNYYKEVLPSPRTQRPKLNLKAQYYNEFEDYLMQRKKLGKNQPPQSYRNYPPHNDNIESNDSSALIELGNKKYKSQLSKNANKEINLQRDAGTMSSLHSPIFNNEQSNVTTDSTLNKTQDTDLSVDKTDKALNEIKDILQSFLQEIKKDNTVSQCDNLDITSRTADKCLNDLPPDSPKLNTTIIPNSGVSMNNFGMPQCNMPPNYMPPFTNPCCYPLLPVCPMNCVQNGYALPNPSFTCACVNQSKEGACSKHTTESNESQTVKTATETEELIKEIYKFVAQNSNNNQRHDYPEKMPESPKANFNEDKILTSRSVGGYSKLSKHDAKVGTQKIKCYSKSCEAIGSRMASETYYSQTNPTYSDTLLDKLSLEATGTDTESEFSSESTQDKKELQDKQNKFSRVLRSFGLLKKKKDIIEELSESGSTTTADIKHQKPTFRQEVTNYVMHDQEYYEQPPMPEHNDPYRSSSQENRYDYTDNSHCHADYKITGRKSQKHASVLDHCYPHKMSHEYGTASPCRLPRPHPSAPPYPNLYDVHHNQPQVPLCLKEIEVQSTGTQSERKMSFFRKFTKKKQAPAVTYKVDDSGARNCSTQTAGVALKTKPDDKPGMFNWKALKAKVNELDKPDNFAFSTKTQKQLADNDLKMKKAMLKKLFNKRNPFSTRNLIMRTILGKDKSSFGQAPKMYRPKMFL